jgi:hypothetical protein
MRRPNLTLQSERELQYAQRNIAKAVAYIAGKSDAVLLECLWQSEKGDKPNSDVAAVLRYYLAYRGAIRLIDRWDSWPNHALRVKLEDLSYWSKAISKHSH